MKRTFVSFVSFSLCPLCLAQPVNTKTTKGRHKVHKGRLIGPLGHTGWLRGVYCLVTQVGGVSAGSEMCVPKVKKRATKRQNHGSKHRFWRFQNEIERGSALKRHGKYTEKKRSGTFCGVFSVMFLRRSGYGFCPASIAKTKRPRRLIATGTFGNCALTACGLLPRRDPARGGQECPRSVATSTGSVWVAVGDRPFS